MSLITKLAAVVFIFICGSCRDKISDDKYAHQNVSVENKSNFTSEKLSEELNKITYPDLTLDDVNHEEAIAFLRQMGAERHPNAPFIIPFKICPNISSKKKFTIKCANLTFNELLDRICAEAGLAWKVDDGKVVVCEKSRK